MLSIAVVGAGAIAHTHLEAFAKYPDLCRIVAVCDKCPEKAERLIEELGLQTQVFSSLEEAAQSVQIDAVSLCLPPALHAREAVWALEHNVHVLVEKPMANSLEECDRMIAAAEASGRILSVVCQLRFTTPVQRVRRLLAEGDLSPVRYAVVNSLWWRGEHYHDAAWRGTWRSEGGGVLTVQAIHHLDMLQYLIGMPRRITATMGNVGHGNTQCEDVAGAAFEYDDKFAQVTASLVAHGEQQEICLYTDEAALSIPWQVHASRAMPNGYPEHAADEEQRLQEAFLAIPPLKVEHHAAQIGNFLRACAGQEALQVDGREGRKPVELTTAIYKSATLHQPVELPISASDPFYTLDGKVENLPHFHEKYRSASQMAEGAITFAR